MKAAVRGRKREHQRRKPTRAAQAVEQALDIDNATFLHALFGTEHAVHLCAFENDPNDSNIGKWKGYNTALASLRLPPIDWNTYYSTGRFPINVNGRRLKAEALEVVVIVIDEAGADLPLPPSYRLQTGPQTQQAGFLLKAGVPVARTEGLMKYLGAKKLLGNDPSGNNPVRYVRLPQGVNTKAIYPEPFPHRLLEWNPERRCSIEELEQAFGVGVAPATKGNGEDRAPPTDALTRVGDDYLRDEELIRRLLADENYHDPEIRLAARYAHRGMERGPIIATIQGFFQAAGKTKDTWQARYDDIARCVDDALEKFGPKKLAELTPAFFTPEELLGPIAPERYLIPGLAPVGAYALIAGALATYKTILEHTLLLSRASGVDLLGLIGPQYESLPSGACMLLSYEDNDTHIRRRIQILTQFYNAELLACFGHARAHAFLEAIHDNLARLTLTGSKDASLVARIDGALQQNDAFVDRLAVAVGAGTLIAIDPLRLAIRGSQNDDDGADVAVNTFNGLANMHDGCGVVSTSHTTKVMAVSGAANSTAKAYGTSGSALYSQHARSNLHTGKLTAKEMREGFAPDTFSLEEIERGRAVCLTHARLSHAAEGHDRYFVMRSGVLVPVALVEGVDLKAAARRELAAIGDALARLTAAGQVTSMNALENDPELRKVIPRDKVRKAIERGGENGWLVVPEAGKGKTRIIEMTAEGIAYRAAAV
jgi:hypothetical protein